MGLAAEKQIETALKPSSNVVFSPRSPLAETTRSCMRIAASDATVLLSGETGTGKEVFARLIHTSSPRAARPFVPVNCGAIPEALLESELFGYVRGAFTGAVAPRKGRVAMAEGGTLFLDEIGELPLALQVKLLRLLQERTFEPVGSSESVSANFRLVAATNRDLAEEVKAGRFRSDLYYRLHVCPIRLPALRERPEDITHLFAHFWARRGETRPVAPEVLNCLARYDWPGNVRELENLVERLAVCSEGPVIRLADLPHPIRPAGETDSDAYGAEPMMDFEVENTGELEFPMMFMPEAPRSVAALAGPALPMAAGAPLSSASYTPAPLAFPVERTPGPVSLPADLPRMLRDLENSFIDAALAQTHNNKKEAAKLLGLGRTTLVEKLRRRGVDTSSP